MEEPRKPADWMQPIDDRILEILSTTELVLSPAVISINIDKSRDEVNRRLSKLTAAGLVQRVKRGYYRISDTGDGYVAGEFDARDIEEPN